MPLAENYLSRPRETRLLLTENSSNGVCGFVMVILSILPIALIAKQAVMEDDYYNVSKNNRRNNNKLQ